MGDRDLDFQLHTKYLVVRTEADTTGKLGGDDASVGIGGELCVDIITPRFAHMDTYTFAGRGWGVCGSLLKTNTGKLQERVGVEFLPFILSGRVSLPVSGSLVLQQNEEGNNQVGGVFNLGLLYTPQGLNHAGIRIYYGADLGIGGLGKGETDKGGVIAEMQFKLGIAFRP